MLTFGSLFSGIGGIDLGLERAGMQCAWQLEIDNYAQRVLAKHWPNVPRYRDVWECGAHNLPAVDLICGGFPCQPHSTAGKRRGAADERNLWPEFARIIRELRPRWVLAENVPGLLSTDAGRFFGAILGDLDALGYGIEWHCIQAADVGAPHIRDRVYIVAYTTDTVRWQINGALADCEGTHSSQAQEWAIRQGDRRAGHDRSTKSGSASRISDVADSSIARSWRLAAGQQDEDASANTDGRSQIMADAECDRLEEPRVLYPARQPIKRDWLVEPDVGRMAHGIPHRVDRLRGLGNAVVPQVAEFIGRCIVEAEAALRQAVGANKKGSNDGQR